MAMQSLSNVLVGKSNVAELPLRDRRTSTVEALDLSESYITANLLPRPPKYAAIFAHTETVIETDSMALWPDLRKGRGSGCAAPFSSIVRQRNT